MHGCPGKYCNSLAEYPGPGGRTRQCNRPKTATPAVVPTNTLPSATATSAQAFGLRHIGRLQLFTNVSVLYSTNQ